MVCIKLVRLYNDVNKELLSLASAYFEEICSYRNY